MHAANSYAMPPFSPLDEYTTYIKCIHLPLYNVRIYINGKIHWWNSTKAELLFVESKQELVQQHLYYIYDAKYLMTNKRNIIPTLKWFFHIYVTLFYWKIDKNLYESNNVYTINWHKHNEPTVVYYCIVTTSLVFSTWLFRQARNTKYPFQFHFTDVILLYRTRTQPWTLYIFIIPCFVLFIFLFWFFYSSDVLQVSFIRFFSYLFRLHRIHRLTFKITS